MLSKALAKITPKTILVVGDILLDKYTFGTASRISPEAPVPVLLAGKEEMKAGGAGNVALNLIALGMKVRLLGRIGNDTHGEDLLSLLQHTDLDTSCIVRENGYSTSTKTRYIAGSQQLLRVDHEKVVSIAPETEKNVVANLPSIMRGVDLVAISDYAKGFLSDGLLRAVIDYARAAGIICITDPKSVDFRKYAGSTILKPNLSETMKAAPSTMTTLEEAAQFLAKSIEIDVLLVTRSEGGISLFYPSGFSEHFPVEQKEVRDGTGSGDIVLAMLSAACACRLPLKEAVSLANVAAACGLLHIGCAHVSLQEVASHIIDNAAADKIWHADNFGGLLETLHLEKLLMIRITSGILSSPDLSKLASIANMHPDRKVIACFENEVSDRKLLELIASLKPFRLVVHGLKGDKSFGVHSPHHMVVNL
jgi:rfaE bifunctional protein kinase chain/domain